MNILNIPIILKIFVSFSFLWYIFYNINKSENIIKIKLYISVNISNVTNEFVVKK